jgi:hypothetical protein
VSDRKPVPVITIKPEPSPEELAAIVAAVTSALAAMEPSSGPELRPATRWAKQGRRDAMGGRDDDGMKR